MSDELGYAEEQIDLVIQTEAATEPEPIPDVAPPILPVEVSEVEHISDPVKKMLLESGDEPEPKALV